MFKLKRRFNHHKRRFILAKGLALKINLLQGYFKLSFACGKFSKVHLLILSYLCKQKRRWSSNSEPSSWTMQIYFMSGKTICRCGRWDRHSVLFLILHWNKYVLQAQNDTFYAAGQMRLMVDLIDQGETKTIGCVDLYDFSPKDFRAAMGILFSSEHRGRGYAKPVVEMLWEYVTKVYSLHCLYSFVPSDNLSSKKMLISSGFEPTSVLKDWLCENGKFKDVEVYQKINRTKDEK